MCEHSDNLRMKPETEIVVVVWSPSSLWTRTIPQPGAFLHISAQTCMGSTLVGSLAHWMYFCLKRPVDNVHYAHSDRFHWNVQKNSPTFCFWISPLLMVTWLHSLGSVHWLFGLWILFQDAKDFTKWSILRFRDPNFTVIYLRHIMMPKKNHKVGFTKPIVYPSLYTGHGIAVADIKTPHSCLYITSLWLRVLALAVVRFRLVNFPIRNLVCWL